MRPKWKRMVFAGLAVVLFTASWRLLVVESQQRLKSVNSPASTAAPAVVPERFVQPKRDGIREIDFQAEFSSLLAPFQHDENDPMAREKRAAAFQAHVEAIASFKMPVAFEAIALMQGREATEAREDLLARLAQRWAELDPGAAALGVARLAADSSEACRRVASTWARTDARAAIAWAENLTDVGPRDAALTAIAQENAPADPIGTLTLLSEIDRPPDGIVNDAVRAWIERDPDAAVDWTERMPTGPMRDAALAGVAGALSDTNPVEAATIAIQELTSSPNRDNVLLGIVQRWATHDYAAAEAWVNRFPAGELRARALRQLTRMPAAHPL